MLDAIESANARLDRLCELNVIEQARHVCQTTIVQDAWARNQPLSIHGWIYGLDDGRLRNLGASATDVAGIDAAYRRAVSSLGAEQAVER